MADDTIGGSNFNSRTNEPSIREVVTALDDLKELVTAKISALDTKINFVSDQAVERSRAADQEMLRSDQRNQTAVQEIKEQTKLAFDSANKYTEMAREAAEKAVLKAENANEKRFEGVNEFRQQLSDQATTFMPRKESESAFEQNRRSLDELKRDLASFQETVRRDREAMIGPIRADMQSLRESRSAGEGHNERSKEGMVNNHWLVGIIISILTIGLTVLIWVVSHINLKL